jgi:hypothetical protein
VKDEDEDDNGDEADADGQEARIRRLFRPMDGD